MNDTSQTQKTSLHSEARIASGALQGLRRDLFVDAFAFRPLPPLDDAQLAARLPWLPARARRYVRWTPHALVSCFSALVLMVTLVESLSHGPVVGLLLGGFCLVFALTPVMTLFRPVGAFWVSFAALAIALIASAGFRDGYVDGYPYGSDSRWVTMVAAVHLAVMALTVLRTRPRMALEMWLVTFAGGALFSIVGGARPSGVAAYAVYGAVPLILAAAIRAWRQEHQQVVKTQTVTAEERSRRTLLEERATIARELHDVVAHHMSVIAIQAEAAPYRVKDTPPELARSFTTIRENAVAALTELRRILGVVRADPDAFADADPEAPQPTLASLDSLLESVRGAGLGVEAVVTGARRPLPQGVELSAYRIVQEALSNALRHSPGAEARVEISYVLGGLGVRIVNGRPNRLAKPSPGAGHGVLGMHERVGMLGGEMTNGPTDDGGYEVAVFIPVAPAPAADTEVDA